MQFVYQYNPHTVRQEFLVLTDFQTPPVPTLDNDHAIPDEIIKIKVVLNSSKLNLPFSTIHSALLIDFSRPKSNNFIRLPEDQRQSID